MWIMGVKLGKCVAYILNTENRVQLWWWSLWFQHAGGRHFEGYMVSSKPDWTIDTILNSTKPDKQSKFREHGRVHNKHSALGYQKPRQQCFTWTNWNSPNTVLAKNVCHSIYKINETSQEHKDGPTCGINKKQKQTKTKQIKPCPENNKRWNHSHLKLRI